jgi:CheY-like chemotaxis protein
MDVKILVVDDEPYMQRLIQHHLEQAGYVVLKADNGSEALEVIAEERPHLVIMDFMIPEVNGLQVLQELRNRESTREIPVIMMTSHSYRLSRQEAEASGASSFCTKPFSPTRLMMEIKRLTGTRATR